MAERRSPEPGGDDANGDTDERDRERGWRHREGGKPRPGGQGAWPPLPALPLLAASTARGGPLLTLGLSSLLGTMGTVITAPLTSQARGEDRMRW